MYRIETGEGPVVAEVRIGLTKHQVKALKLLSRRGWRPRGEWQAMAAYMLAERIRMALDERIDEGETVPYLPGNWDVG